MRTYRTIEIAKCADGKYEICLPSANTLSTWDALFDGDMSKPNLQFNRAGSFLRYLEYEQLPKYVRTKLALMAPMADNTSCDFGHKVTDTFYLMSVPAKVWEELAS